jgi:hypothetical protein
MQDIEQAIRERAFQIWSESGCPNGQDDAHWLEAQREILSSSLGELGAAVSEVSAKLKKARASRKRQRAA